MTRTMDPTKLRSWWKTIQRSWFSHPPIGGWFDPVWERWYGYQLSRPYPPPYPNESVGAFGERLASIYLERKGYFILERSFRTKTGEIDLIAVWKKKLLVFVEVKTGEFGPPSGEGPSDRVDDRKQKKITDTALRYMKQHRLFGTSGRADVIEVVLRPESGKGPCFRHFESAFQASGQFQMFS
ncbi:YraN family protein [Pirellulaceae bacterium SH501]